MEKLSAMQLSTDQVLIDELARSNGLTQLPDWTVSDSQVPQLVRQFKFTSYAKAVVFVNSLAVLAETNDHHPAMLIEWGKVTVSWWTHSLGGLHINDFILAAQTDRIYGEV